MSENQSTLGININMNLLSDIMEKGLSGRKQEEDNKSEEKPGQLLNIQDNINEVVNKIANSINDTAENKSLTTEDNLSKDSEGNASEDTKDANQNQQDKKINSDNMSGILNEIVSKIKVVDGYEDDIPNDEISKETFGMTEATEAKPISSRESETDNQEETQNQEDNKNKKKKKKQAQESDDDDENIVQYTDEQLSEAFELFRQDKTIPPFLMRDAILDYARRQSLQFMVDENYDAAYKNDLSVNDLLLAFSKDSGGYTTESITRNLESRIEMAKEQRQASNEKYQKRILQVKENEQKKLQQLIEIQACERKQFELDCQSAEFLQRFSKPSKKLLQVRKIQKALALAHKFEDAKSIKAEGDALQRSETIQAKKRAIRYIKSSYQKLLEKQQNQINCAAENRDRKIRALMGQLERENAANLNLTRQLEIRLKETKSKKGSSLPPLISGGPKKVTSKSTLRQLADYKSTQKISMLNVKLTNIQKIVGHVKPSTKPIKIV